MSTSLPARHVKRRHPRGAYHISPKIILALLLFFLFGALIGHKIFAPPKAVIPEKVGAIPVCTDFLPENYAGYSGVERRIRYIVIHETDNYSASATARAHDSFLHSEKQKNTPLSWHYTVDENEIYHHLPDNIAGYHASDSMTPKGGNESGVGIELCVNKGSDFSRTVDNAAQLTAYLLHSYHLNISAVKQHYDFCGKDCPDRLRENDNWDNFLSLVQKYLKEY